MATLQSLPYWQVLDDNGLPASGALIYSYYVGSSTPRDTYASHIGDVTAAWPLQADSQGRLTVYLGTGLYKMIVCDSQNNIIKTVDGVGGSGGSLIVETVAGTDALKDLPAAISSFVICEGYWNKGDGGGGEFYWGANITTGQDDGSIIAPNTPDPLNPGSWIRIFNGNEPANILYWGARNGQTADVQIGNAITFSTTNDRALKIPTGTFLLTGDPGFVITLPVEFDPGAVLSWSNQFHPAIMPVIGRDDRTMHFTCNFAPMFAAGTEATPMWFTDTINFGDAIQQGMDALTTNGGVLRFPDGTYSVDYMLVPASNVQIVGQGPTSIIQQSATFTQSFLMDGTVNNFGIRDVAFNALQGITSVQGLRVCGDNIEIQGTIFSDMMYPLTIGGVSGVQGTNIKIHNNEITNCTSAGLVLNSGGVDVIDNHIIMTTDSPAISHVASTTGTNRILRNKIEMPTGYTDGILLTQDGSPGFVEVKENSIICDGTNQDAAIKISDMVKTVVLDDNFMQGDSSTVGTGIKETGTVSSIYGPGNIISKMGTEYVTTESRWIDLGHNLELEINGDMTALNNVQINGSTVINNNLNVAQNTVMNQLTVQDATAVNLHTTTLTFGPNNVFIQDAKTFPCIVGRQYPFIVDNSDVGNGTPKPTFDITYQEFFNLIAINVPYFGDTTVGNSDTWSVYPHLTSTIPNYLTVNTGPFDVTTAANMQVTVGAPVQFTDMSSTAKYMAGLVTSYDPPTGHLIVDMTTLGTAGSATGWNVAFDRFPTEFPASGSVQAAVISGKQSCPGVIQMFPTHWKVGVASVGAGFAGNNCAYQVKPKSGSDAWTTPYGLGTTLDSTTCSSQTITVMVPS